MDQICTMVFPVENKKSDHRHVILHIWISVGIKFKFKLIILSFRTKFAQKRYFQLKTEQAVQGLQTFAFCEVKISWTIVFKNCQVLKEFIIWVLEKSKWLVKSRLNLYLNFRFKFLYNFRGQLKKLKLVMVMVKSFDK